MTSPTLGVTVDTPDEPLPASKHLPPVPVIETVDAVYGVDVPERREPAYQGQI